MVKTCKEKATEYVNLTAVAAGGVAVVPVPGMGTAGLIALEGGLVYWIARIYGEQLTSGELLALTTSLKVASVALKLGVLETLNLLPIAGWLLKAPLAAGVVKQIGSFAVKHFEDKHPGKLYTLDPDVERQRAR